MRYETIRVNCGGDKPSCPFVEIHPFANFRECRHPRVHTRSICPNDFPEIEKPPEWCPIRMASVRLVIVQD